LTAANRRDTKHFYFTLYIKKIKSNNEVFAKTRGAGKENGIKTAYAASAFSQKMPLPTMRRFKLRKRILVYDVQQ
jgi:hypothetical protein